MLHSWQLTRAKRAKEQINFKSLNYENIFFDCIVFYWNAYGYNRNKLGLCLVGSSFFRETFSEI